MNAQAPTGMIVDLASEAPSTHPLTEGTNRRGFLKSGAAFAAAAVGWIATSDAGAIGTSQTIHQTDSVQGNLMPLEIICLEEHTVDAQIAKATRSTALEEAPYADDVNSIYHDDSMAQPTDRPRFVESKTAFRLAGQSIADRLPAMDQAGIDMQIVSYSNATQDAPPAQAASLAQAANDRLAEAVRKHPNRFGGFCTLPWQDTDAAVRELERCVQQLGIRATLLIGRPGKSVFLEDKQFEPILAKLAELDAPLYIHPGAPLLQVQQPYYGGLNKEVTARLSLFGWGWHHEAGIQVVRLILSGALDRHPNLKIISGHWGEMVPFFLQRLDDMIPQGASGLRRTITQTYRDQVWVTPSGMLNMPHFNFVHETLGYERIMFSVDYPYLTMTGARSWLESLPVAEKERVAIASGNAKKLFRL
jgi:uncharacterized protein